MKIKLTQSDIYCLLENGFFNLNEDQSNCHIKLELMSETKVFVNDWGRRTYKSAEAKRIYENSKDATLLVHANRNLGNIEFPTLTKNAEVVYDYATKCYVLRTGDRGQHDIDILGRTIILDEPQLVIKDIDDLTKLVKDLVDAEAKEVHLYGDFELRALAWETLLGTDSIFYNHREAPIDVQQQIDSQTKGD
jgi:hypothetical protein